MNPFTKALVLLLSLALLLPLAACGQKPAAEPPSGAGKTYYVDFSAAAGGDGSEAKPFASIPAARDAIRALKASSGLPDGGVEVILAAGTAHLTETVAFTAEDSGTADCPITYRAAEGAEVVLDGGVTLLPEYQTALPSEARERLPESARERVVAFDLAAAGCFDLSDKAYSWGLVQDFYRQELYVGGRRQTVARWPNEGDGFAKTSCAVDLDAYNARTVIPAEKAALWEGEQTIRCVIYPRAIWNAIAVTLDGVDTATSELVFPGVGGIYNDKPYYLYNLLCELDTPGEYYWDVAASMLYYWPTEGWEGQEVSFSQVNDLIEFECTSYVSLDGLTLRNARGRAVSAIAVPNAVEPAYELVDIGSGFTRQRGSARGEAQEGSAFAVFGIGNSASVAYGEDGSEPGHITVENCRVTACYAGMALEGIGQTVRGCELHELGAYALWFNNAAGIAGRRSAGSVAENNLFYDWAQVTRLYNPGVMTVGYGYRISHNEFHDAPHSAVICYSGDTVVEYNEMHDVCSDCADAGAIYTVSRWTFGGNTYRYNYIYNVAETIGNSGGTAPCGIYLDDTAPAQTVYGNLFVNIAGAGVVVASGKGVMVENNVFAEMAYTGVELCDRPYSWPMDDTVLRSTLWRYARPDLLLALNLPTEEVPTADYPTACSYGSCNSNIGYHITRETLVLRSDAAKGGYTALYDNVDYGDADPGFVDAANGDYTLREDSRVFSELLHFEPLPLDRIGRIG